MDESVSVRPAVAFRTQLTLGRVDGSSAAAPLTRELFTELRKVEASVSTVPLVWGQGLTAYLEGYAYSCTEQLVSKGMAALILSARPEFGTVKSRDANPLDVTYGVLRGRANDQGGFGLWSSSPQTAEFATVYAAHFLVEARERGQKTPPEIMAALDEWLTRFASTPASNPGGRSAARLCGVPAGTTGNQSNPAIANVEQELTRRYPQQWTTDLAAAYLASTYRLMQRTADADRIVAGRPVGGAEARVGRGNLLRRGGARRTAFVSCWRGIFRPAWKLPRLLSKPSARLSVAIAQPRFRRLTHCSVSTPTPRRRRRRSNSGSPKSPETSRRALTLPSESMPKVSIGRTRPSAILEGRRTRRLLRDQRIRVRSQSAGDRISQGIEIIREFLDAKGTV
jgi:hypothetical protein